VRARGIGYQGLSLESFVERLLGDGIAVIADVRLTPLSRKPGFSKRALAQALDTVGIRYVHLRELGNPKWNRAGFGGDEAELRAAKRTYRDGLASADAQRALADLRGLAGTEPVGVLCFEADEDRCHRSVVLEVIRTRPDGPLAVAASRRQAR
jgi:uncharacterized protein (DUF488 family)